MVERDPYKVDVAGSIPATRTSLIINITNIIMLRVFLGIGIVAVGFVFVWKTEWFLRNLGRVEWAEKHLGFEGGSRLFYKLMGIVIIFLGFFVISGIWHDIMNSFAGLFGI